jgi:hypothetical protein
MQHRERHISFTGEMAEAAFQGAKTQTRRPVRDVPPPAFRFPRALKYKGWQFYEKARGGGSWPGKGLWCPYGRSGQLLWIREPYWIYDEPEGQSQVYRGLAGFHGSLHPGQRIEGATMLRPSAMPRQFSRTLLGVTGVQVERLSETTEAGALQEGFNDIMAFSRAWDGIYGDREGHRWADDPWVWVVSFKIVSRTANPS